MSDVSVKSTGQLLDELVTNAFKTQFAVEQARSTEEFDLRYEALRKVLTQRLGQDVAGFVHDLAVVSYATWQAQEIVMHELDDHVAARAGRRAQKMNARRTHLIREIDRLLGEAGITITTKTYG